MHACSELTLEAGTLWPVRTLQLYTPVWLSVGASFAAGDEYNGVSSRADTMLTPTPTFMV
jgi:hypothetical protein